jgi:restriction endonuclease S subunit
LSKTEVESDGIYECILYGELYTKYNNPFIDKIYSKTNVKGKILSNYGDVLIPATTTSDEDGIAIAKTLCKKDVVIGNDINIIRIHGQDKINPQYLSLVLNYTLKNELAKYARGANILHLSNNDIKKIKIPLPPLEEQKK